MLEIKFSPHALTRMEEREISKEMVSDALENPDKVDSSSRNQERVLVKKLYFNQKLNKEHLLLVIIEKTGNQVSIITIIDTSKVSKYF